MRHASMRSCASASVANQCSLGHSSRNFPLKLSTNAFSIGLPAEAVGHPLRRFLRSASVRAAVLAGVTRVDTLDPAAPTEGQCGSRTIIPEVFSMPNRTEPKTPGQWLRYILMAAVALFLVWWMLQPYML
jgi:hypothetical protein